MSRYIDADKLINELEPVVKSAAFKNRNIRSNVNKCWEIVNNQPTADVVEVVRCKDCKYAEVADPEDSQDGYTCQFHRGSIWFSGSYCSWAERADA